MAVVSMKQLLEAGVHFGHTTKRWDPRMKPYIFTARNGIYIIDLKITAEKITEAYQAMLEIVQQGGKVLFVGTKKQAQEVVREVAQKTDQFYVDQRWLGGTLTNFKTIRRRIKYLKDLYRMEEDGIFEKLPKKEVLDLIKQRNKLEKNLSGIKEMQKLPDAVFIVDPRKEINAIREARKLGIPVFGIVDTNCNPNDVDYVIPSNDDAIRAVKLIVEIMGNAVIEGQGGVVEHLPDEEDYDENAVLEGEIVDKDEEARKENQRKPKKSQKKAKKVEPKEKQDAPKVKEEKKAEPAKKEEKKAEPAKKAEPVKKEEKKAEPVKKEKTDNKESKPIKLNENEQVSIEDDLTLKTVAELRQVCKDMNLSGYSKLRKAELIEFIQEAQQNK